MDNNTIIALVIVALVVGDLIGIVIISGKERALDTSTPKGAGQRHMFRVIRYIMHLHTLIIPLILWFVVRPLIAH